MAKDAAQRQDPGRGSARVDGRPTLKLEVGDGAWYVAQDEPVLIRRELRGPDGAVQRTDFATFEVLEATPANRKLLRIDAPRNARVVSRTSPPYRQPAMIPQPSTP